jgi:AraC-like DNA-binding protein
LVVGGGTVNYADKVINVKKQALSFSNPHIPYSWENKELITGGAYCIFNKHFFHQFGDLNQYSVFQPIGDHIFELTDEQANWVQSIYERMFEEINSDYLHKYDVLRNLVFELLHFAIKIKPVTRIEKLVGNASQRISTLFMELLERQFPIDDDHRQVYLRSASDFANQLNIHVNHLNRALRETTRKTTTRIISERLLKESKILLKHSNWDVSEIAYALNFKEATHFSNFFKKHVQISPTQFRSS